MKFINLVFQGIANQNASVNLENKIQGGIAVTELDKGTLKDAIGIALFGTMGDASKLTSYPAKVELSFSTEDVVYTIIRTYSIGEGQTEPTEYAIITDFAQTTPYAEGVAEVNAYMAKVVYFTAAAFNALFVVNKEDLSEVLSADSLTRESFLAMALNEISSIEDIAANTAELKQAEAELIGEIEEIYPVSRKEIKAQQSIVKADKVKLVAINKDMEAANVEMAKIVVYEQDVAELAKLNEAIEQVKESQAEIEVVEKALSESDTAGSMMALYTKYTAIEADTAAGRIALEDEQKELDRLNAKAAGAETSVDNLSKKYVYLNTKEEELKKGMLALIEQSYNDPKTYKVKEEVESYYEDIDKEVAALQEELAATEANSTKHKQEIAALQDRKLSLRNTSAYRKIICDGTVLETQLQASNDAIDNAMDKLQADRVAQSLKYDEHTTLSKQITDMTAEQAELNSKIVGSYANYQEAVNADAVYKQTLYGKQLTVSAYEVEIAAITKKIAAVDKTTAIYAEKLAASIDGKAQLDTHMSNLQAKLVSLESKFSLVAGEASLCALAEEIEYGSRCPICSGFVTSKADLGSQSTKAIETQIISVKEEITLGLTKIESIQDSIGQYTAAKNVSENYAKSLIETKNVKIAIINGILAEYEVETVEDLVNLLKAAIAKSNELTVNIDKYRNSNVILNGLTEKNNEIVAQYDAYTKLIDKKQAELDAMLAENKEIVNSYIQIQPDLNGQNAEDLIAKQHVINKEYEDIEARQELLQAELVVLEAHIAELKEVLTVLETRGINVDVNGIAMSYHDVIVRVIMSDLSKLGKSITATVEEKEVVKVRLVAIKKVLAETKAMIADKVEEIAAETSRLDTQSAVATTMYSDYSAQVSDLGVTTVEELQALILSEDKHEAYSKAIADNNEIIIRQAEASDILTAKIEANAPYYENREILTATFDELKINEFAAIGKLHDDSEILEDMENRYKTILKLNKELSYLQRRLKRIDEIAPAITETSVLAKDFADLIYNKANSLVKNWTNDNYALIMKDDGKIVLFNNKKGKEPRAGKLNKEEKMINALALPLAYNSRVSDLLGFSLTPAMQIGASESDKNSLSILAASSVEHDIITIPEDESIFMRGISKI